MGTHSRIVRCDKVSTKAGQVQLPCSYRVDFICYESVLVEVKALSAITPRERSQILNYLRASNLHRGLLLNFGTATLQTQRLVWGLEDDALQKREITRENTERHNDPGDSARS